MRPAERTQPFGTPRRWVVFALGVGALVVGIALAITADLGVGSWQVLEIGLVEATAWPRRRSPRRWPGPPHRPRYRSRQVVDGAPSVG